ncbi:MAG TPA: DNA-directed RNA polymerase subunit beta [Dehalococcoidia bacterium]|nr:DNA-directed RNA polymerase subunit beta [Dehalococcoidia bacterium]
MTLSRDVVRFGEYLPTTEKWYSHIPQIMEMPNLIKVQLDSYEWFTREGLRELLDEISPIQDFTGSKMELRFGEYSFGEPKYSEAECRDRDATFAAPLRVKVELIVKETGEVKEQELFMGDFPLMTPTGTFIINGAERVVVSQLVRSPGVYFTREKDPTTGRDLAYAKVIPNRGAWLEFETSNRDVISVKVDRKRKIPVTTLLRAIDSEEGSKDQDLGTAERVLKWFEDIDVNPDHHYLATTVEKETPEVKVGNKLRALEDFYKRMRPGDPPTLENARTLVNSLFFNPRRYDLLKVGRYKINRRLKLETALDDRVLTVNDIKGIVAELIRLNNGIGDTDEIDHLGNRRVRAVGELIQNQFRIGLLRMERVVRERMTITDPDQATPSALINIRPVVAAMKEFFGGSQLSQFMDQTNPLAELTHKRKLSALGPGGLSRDHAGFDVRDVHHSHYGRICPIETPEGPNIGLIVSLASFAVINDYGFIETPYRRVIQELAADSKLLLGRTIREDVMEGRKTYAKAGEVVTEAVAKKLAPLGVKHVKIKPYASTEIHYLAADDEDQFVIAQANALIDETGTFLEEEVEVRDGQRFEFMEPDRIDFMDVSPKQILSTATSLIPFLEHDDAPRALMGSNMQRQAVPLLRPERPLVGTGTERQVAVDSGQVVVAEGDGEVLSATAREVVVKYKKNETETTYPVMKFIRSNAATCLNQRPAVTIGDKVKAGDTLIDSSSTDNGELALGQSVLCCFMSWEGYNFEDAIILSETIVRSDKFSSIHIEKHEIEARDTKLGPEEITRDIPNVGDESLKDLDEEGIIRIGAEVQAGDILVGKITPKGETELTAEEKLLRAIFGEKAREVKDTSLRVPHGQHGKVIDVRVFRREDHDELPAGVNQLVRVSIAQKRKVSEGDKMAGRHGNKGVIARILPVEDMPYLADGTPVDIILNPIGVPSRMNVGQVLETHLGWAANALGFRAITPVFDGADDISIEDALARAWLAAEADALEPGLSAQTPAWGENLDIPAMEEYLTKNGYEFQKVFDESLQGEAKRASQEIWLKGIGEKFKKTASVEDLEKLAEDIAIRRRLAAPIFGRQLLYDGRTGEAFDQPVTVGQIYMLKLVHQVEEKIHARSTGPYSLITQQPLGGKAQMGGQRFGEMEVWALEAYGAAHTLQELLTVKSDDVVGRVKTYEAIVKGDDVLEPGIPESFKVLVKELQSLGLAVEVLNEDEEQVMFADDGGEDVPQIGINLTGFESEDFLGERV